MLMIYMFLAVTHFFHPIKLYSFNFLFFTRLRLNLSIFINEIEHHSYHNSFVTLFTLLFHPLKYSYFCIFPIKKMYPSTLFYLSSKQKFHQSFLLCLFCEQLLKFLYFVITYLNFAELIFIFYGPKLKLLHQVKYLWLS